MFSEPTQPEINHNTIKLLIGLIALSLANITSFFSSEPLKSISASYYEAGWARDFFVGFLFAISAFMLAYNGESRKEMLSSKFAAIAALGVALFPCGCGSHKESVPYVHYLSATVMFSILAYFCWIFYKRATDKGHIEALRRSNIYFICGVFILGSMLIMAIDYLTQGSLSSGIHRLTFYCERAGLVAFGISWLTASKVFPFISSENERLRPFN
jgi:hypothetical protein